MRILTLIMISVISVFAIFKAADSNPEKVATTEQTPSIEIETSAVETSAVEAPVIEITEADIVIEEIAPKKIVIKTIKESKTKKTAKVKADSNIKKIDEVKTSQASILKSEIKLPTKKTEESSKRFRGAISVSAETDFKEFSDETKSTSGEMAFSLMYKINDSYGAKISASASKDLSDSYEQELGDIKVSLSHKALSLTEKLKLSPSVAVGLPTSKDSKLLYEQYGTLDLRAGLSYGITDTITASYGPMVRKYFNKYTTSKDGTLLDSYRVYHSTALSFSVTEKFSITPSLVYINVWAYTGTRHNDKAGTSLDLSYSVSESLSASVGTSTRGSIYATEKGPDKSITIYDKNKSSFYMNVGIVF